MKKLGAILVQDVFRPLTSTTISSHMIRFKDVLVNLTSNLAIFRFPTIIPQTLEVTDVEPI